MTKRIFLSLVVAILSAYLSASALAERFTIAVIPDTQQEMAGPADHFANRLQWLVDNRQALNLKMVLHSGDLVNWDTPGHEQFAKASTGLEILERAKIPYAIALGNHDTAAVKPGGSAAPGNVNANLRTTTTFNAYFPARRFANLQGVFEEGRVDNAWHTFSAGGLEWLVLNLELWPRTPVIEWARSVVEAHPRHNIILLTHSYLNAKGAIEPMRGGYGDNSPQYLFDRLIKPYANVKLIFSGHAGTHACRKDETAAGATVHAFLQCFHDRAGNPTRLVEIDTEKGNLKTWIYVPLTGETRADASAVSLTEMKWVAAK